MGHTMVHVLESGYSRGLQHCLAHDAFEPNPDGDPRVGSLLDQGRSVFDEPGTLPTPLTDDLRQHVPQTWWVKEAPKGGPPALLNASTMLIAHDAVRAKLEELEPGRHTFFPLRIAESATRANGKPRREKDRRSWDDYYIVHVTAKPDAIDFDETLYGRQGKQNDTGKDYTSYFYLPELYNGKTGARAGKLINFKPGILDGHHLWRGTVGRPEWYRISTMRRGPRTGDPAYEDLLAGTLFVSDEFAAFIRENKLRGDKPVRVIEKPLAWLEEQRERGAYR